MGANELEIGLGIHNESGHRRVSPVPPLNQLVPDLIHMITSTTDPDRSFVPFLNDGTDRVVLLVNNLGGLSELELGAVVGEAKNALDKQGIKTIRVLAGTFMVCLSLPYKQATDVGIDKSQHAGFLHHPPASPERPRRQYFFCGSHTFPPRRSHQCPGMEVVFKD